jgi:hypothetical protein
MAEKRRCKYKKIHVMANIRRKKNFIHALESEAGLTTNQADKQEIVYHHLNTLEHIFQGNGC